MLQLFRSDYRSDNCELQLTSSLFEQGVEASIRAEVWLFLLNLYGIFSHTEIFSVSGLMSLCLIQFVLICSYALESTQKEREEERLVRR